MSRPNFFIVGAPKCGTTAWYEYLRTHPDICFSAEKEPHYFCTDLPSFRWAKTEGDYLARFNACDGAAIVAEASVQYLFSSEAALNIHAFAPNAKILIFLRSPGNFLQSYHNQLLLNLDEDIEDIEAAWEASRQIDVRNIPGTCREPRLLDYRAAARFGEQVARYVALFPAEQIKIVDYEEWIQHPRSTYLEILAFLGVQDDGRCDFPAVNAATSAVSNTIARLTRRPPEWVLATAGLLRHLTGRQRLGLARKIRRMNSRPLSVRSVSTELLAEMEDYFREDQELLAMLRSKGNG